MRRGVIFNIERFATKDGPGIRTVVFLKGCPLKCIWCSNPESQNSSPEVIWYPTKCRGCNRCVESCPTGAILQDKRFGLYLDAKKCTLCGECVKACYYGAREIIGREVSSKELCEEVEKDFPYFLKTKGGITFSGGEPLLQSDFLVEVVNLCKKKGDISIAVETCGYVSWREFEVVLPVIDILFFDIKHIYPEEHKRFTGVSNRLILENLKKLNSVSFPVILRIPVIPTINDSVEVHKDMIAFVLKFRNIDTVELLPYHRLGVGKYQGLGRKYLLSDLPALTPEDHNLNRLKMMWKRAGFNARIGTV